LNTANLTLQFHDRTTANMTAQT